MKRQTGKYILSLPSLSLSHVKVYNDKAAVRKPRSGPSSDMRSANTLTLDGQPPEQWERHVCGLNPECAALLQQPALTQSNKHKVDSFYGSAIGKYYSLHLSFNKYLIMSFHAGSSIWKGLKMRESMAVSTGTVKNPPALQGGFLITRPPG